MSFWDYILSQWAGQWYRNNMPTTRDALVQVLRCYELPELFEGGLQEALVLI